MPQLPRISESHRINIRGASGFLIGGDLSRKLDLKTIPETRAQVGSNYPAGIAADTSAIDAVGGMLIPCNKVPEQARKEKLN